MSPSTAAVAMRLAAPPQPLAHFYQLPAPTFFGVYWLYMQGLINPRAMAAHFAITDMHQRRVIGGHRLTNLDLDELTRRLGRRDHKRNRMAVGELLRLKLWHETDLGYQPARSLDHLRIDPTDLRDLAAWVDTHGMSRRRNLCIPRLMFEGFPCLERSQLAISLELLRQCTWTGDKDETKATTPASLKIGDIAKRWRIKPRTVQSVLHSKGLGLDVRLEAVDSPGWRRKRYGCQYAVVVSKGAGQSVSKPDGLTPAPSRLSLVPKAAGPEPKPPVHQNAPMELEPVHQNAPLLIFLALILFLRTDLKTNLNPPAAAEKPEAKLEGEGTGFFKLKPQSEDIAVITPADLTTPARDKKGYQGEDTSEGTDTADPKACPDSADVEALDPDVAPSVMIDSHPTADPAPMPPAVDDRAADIVRPAGDPVDVPAAVTDGPPAVDDQAADTARSAVVMDDGSPPPDWDRLTPSDLSDPARLDRLYEQIIARKILRRSQASELDVWTAAQHALRVGKNPPALFRHTVEHGRWERLTDGDEQTARRMLRKHHEPPTWKRHLKVVPRPPGPPPDVSRDDHPSDVEIVEMVHKRLNELRYEGDFFLRFKMTDEGRTWNRDRWQAALAKSKVRRS